eukprot:SAG11_NODE_2172_length_3721_cov_2.345941_2_plen_52_part_00
MSCVEDKEVAGCPVGAAFKMCLFNVFVWRVMIGGICSPLVVRGGDEVVGGP